jgi:hypothetical protein
MAILPSKTALIRAIDASDFGHNGQPELATLVAHYAFDGKRFPIFTMSDDHLLDIVDALDEYVPVRSLIVMIWEYAEYTTANAIDHIANHPMPPISNAFEEWRPRHMMLKIKIGVVEEWVISSNGGCIMCWSAIYGGDRYCATLGTLNGVDTQDLWRFLCFDDGGQMASAIAECLQGVSLDLLLPLLRSGLQEQIASYIVRAECAEVAGLRASARLRT